jgi:large subunit ribosomal protein L32
MAVPKKRTSKSKKNSRKANWKRKGQQAAQKSLSLAKSMLRGKTTSFVYSIYMLMKNKSLKLFKDLFIL